jgi:putative OmpL-like beta-barrel porin-2
MSRLNEQPAVFESKPPTKKLYFHHERTLYMKKLLIASAVSAAIAAPATALAQARVPTLGQVLDASGINVNGYIDAAYSWANRNIESGIAGSGGNGSPRVFDNQNNSFTLHQFGLTVAKQPKEGFGGLVNLTVGQDARVIHSFPEFGTGSTFDLTQAYGSYSSGALTLIGGKFTTLAGTEVIASTGNTTYSRSILFGAIPFTHTGVRASYAPTDTITLYGGLNNGWDQQQDANRQKTAEIGATFSTKALTLTASGYFGTDPAVPQAGAGPNGERDLIDVVANFIVSNSLSLGAEALTFRQDIPGGTTQKYDGLALYFTMMLDPKWRAVVRGEYFNDKNGFHFLNGVGTKYYEGTLCLSYLPTSSFEARTEVRMDKANNAVYIDSDGSTSKSLMSFGLQGIYKF